MEKITNAGLRAITTSKERQELRMFGQVLTLGYHHMSKEQGEPYGVDTALYNVYVPVPGYTAKDAGVPTLCRENLLKYWPAEVVDAAIRNAPTLHTGNVCKGRPCYQGAL